MFHPLFASSFEGIELAFLVPLLVVVAILGFISVFLRARSFALFCGVVCGITGSIILWFAFRLHGDDQTIGIICGLGGLVALALCVRRRKEKS